ncbi:MAG TPA: O-antigen ligase family protein [Desulfosporosinus sp.]|nr:O-antigen ligase family protein [Desulfosporosinus sp.]
MAGDETELGWTDVLLLGMICFSVLGLVHAVRVKDGLMEALHWGIFWFIYRLGVRISSDEIAKKHLVDYIEWLAIVVAIIGWLPWVSKVAGRLSSVFGYPNATATFLGAVLLLYPRRKSVQIFLGISLLATGSRAGVGLFLIVLMSQQILLCRKKITDINVRGVWAIFIGSFGAVLALVYNRPAWENLTAWGFSSSSWQERLVYYKDGLSLAWNAGGLPQAGGWLAFPTIQRFPYWTADPHSSFIHILLNQGVLGVISVGLWSVFILVQAWKTWGHKCVLPSGALIFLALHSLVDADFFFGALGVLFWLLFGSFQNKDEHPIPLLLKWNRLAVKLSSKGMFVLSLILCLFSGSTLLNPRLLEREVIWNTQARLERKQNPTQSIALWNLSLNWDQTQLSTRREQAELLLKLGNTAAGLKAVEEVLRWQPLDLEAYEWAQSVIWDAAEAQRRTHPEVSNRLYRWVEGVPEKIEGRVANLSLSDRLLWQAYREFQASQHIKLLAEYARQRQLTQLLPRT